MNKISAWLESVLQGMPEGAEGLEELLATVSGFEFPIMLITVICLTFFAYYGYNLFRKALFVVGAVIFGAAGSLYLSPIILTTLGEAAPQNVNVSVVTGIICAVLGAVLIRFLYKFALFICGTLFGYTAGCLILAPLLAQVTKVEWFLTQTGMVVIGAALAIILGIVCVTLFKPVFIISSAIPGMIYSGATLGASIFVSSDEVAVTVCSVIGLLVGMHAAYYQFKHSEG